MIGAELQPFAARERAWSALRAQLGRRRIAAPRPIEHGTRRAIGGKARPLRLASRNSTGVVARRSRLRRASGRIGQLRPAPEERPRCAAVAIPVIDDERMARAWRAPPQLAQHFGMRAVEAHAQPRERDPVAQHIVGAVGSSASSLSTSMRALLVAARQRRDRCARVRSSRRWADAACAACARSAPKARKVPAPAPAALVAQGIACIARIDIRFVVDHSQVMLVQRNARAARAQTRAAGDAPSPTACRRCVRGAIAASPATPAPRSNCSSTVSAWSSSVMREP